jgi:hypothetical protein
MQKTSQKRNRHQPKLSAVKSLTRTRRIPKLDVMGNNSSKTQKTITAAELRKMPLAERSKLLHAAARKAVKDYNPGGSLWVEGVEDIIEY